MADKQNFITRYNPSRTKFVVSSFTLFPNGGLAYYGSIVASREEIISMCLNNRITNASVSPRNNGYSIMIYRKKSTGLSEWYKPHEQSFELIEPRGDKEYLSLAEREIIKLFNKRIDAFRYSNSKPNPIIYNEPQVLCVPTREELASAYPPRSPWRLLEYRELYLCRRFDSLPKIKAQVKLEGGLRDFKGQYILDSISMTLDDAGALKPNWKMQHTLRLSYEEIKKFNNFSILLKEGIHALSDETQAKWDKLSGGM